MADIEPVNLEMPEYLANFPINPDGRVKQDYAEFQEIHNALHTLAYYLKFVRTGIVSSDSKTPDQSVPFTKFLRVTAAEAIEEGNVVGPEIGGWRKGFTRSSHLFTSEPGGLPTDSLVSGKSMNFVGLALEGAAVGEDFLVGIGFAIVKLEGLACGAPVYAQSSRTVRYTREPGEVSLTFLGADWSGDGNLYITRPAPADAPGYPRVVGSLQHFSRAGTAVVGVGVAANYMLFCQELIHDRSTWGDPNRPGNPNIPFV